MPHLSCDAQPPPRQPAIAKRQAVEAVVDSAKKAAISFKKIRAGKTSLPPARRSENLAKRTGEGRWRRGFMRPPASYRGAEGRRCETHDGGPNSTAQMPSGRVGRANSRKGSRLGPLTLTRGSAEQHQRGSGACS